MRTIRFLMDGEIKVDDRSFDGSCNDIDKVDIDVSRGNSNLTIHSTIIKDTDNKSFYATDVSRQLKEANVPESAYLYVEAMWYKLQTTKKMLLEIRNS